MEVVGSLSSPYAVIFHAEFQTYPKYWKKKKLNTEPSRHQRHIDVEMFKPSTYQI